jgi:zinc protease
VWPPTFVQGQASGAASQSASEFALDAAIPFDAAVRSGALPNGLRYFIRENERPAERLSLRLAVKAGSLDEAEDQQGLAHFLEHMAFNGSEHFPPGELVSYFESIGARLGPHVNAYTSFDETVYMLDVPSDDPEVVRQSLTALADFAGGLTIDPEQVDMERGVVIEEWRSRLGAGSRIRDEQVPLLYYQSRYAERLPIGQPDVLRSAPASRLRDFYDTWYQPSRMAFVAVGDFESDALEAQIRELFGAVEARVPAEPRITTSIESHDELLVSIVADVEVTRSSVQMLRKRTSGGDETVADYRRSLVERLFAQMFNERFAELARRPDAPFLRAGVGGDSLSPDVDTFSMSASTPDGSIPAGLTALQIEARRVTEHGFNPGEFERAKRALESTYERAYNEQDTNESSRFAREYVSHFLVGEPSPGIDYEYRLVESMLPGITLEEVTAMARSRLTEGSRVILAVTPQKDGVEPPSEAALREALQSADAVAVMPWVEPETSLALMERAPTPGAIASRRQLPEVGVSVVTFENGVEAWLKPTDFKNDEVRFTMYAMGGSSRADEATFLDAALSTSLVGLSGIGGFQDLELNRMLSGRRASASPFVSLSTHGISGSASPTDLETALQLLYLTFTDPNDDAASLALLKRQLGAMVVNRGKNPGEVFGEKVAAVNTSGHYTSRSITEEDVEALDQEAMLSFYRDRFANAADFTFFMVGAFEPDAILPLLAQYVGSLPSTGVRTSTFRELGIRFPSTIERAQVTKGLEPRSQTLLSFFADPSTDPVEQERIIAASLVLQTTLRDVLREALGQTYTVSVRLNQSPPQVGGGHIRVSFGAAPENIQSMTDRVIQEIKRLQEEGPSDEFISSARESARRGYETSLKENGYWLSRLQTVHMLGRDPREIPTRTERIASITPDVVRDAFREYFPMDRYTVVTLVPELARGPARKH